MRIDAETLLNYQRCYRRAFLERYGDRDQRAPMNDYILKLLQDSRENHRLVLADRPYQQPEYSSDDWQAGFTATLELMRQGVQDIYQGLLVFQTDTGLMLVSQPDLLTKRPGQSCFGDWIYEPTEIKLGKRPKLEYQLITAFHTYVLAQVQEAWPEIAWLNVKEKGWVEVDLWETLPRMLELLDACATMLRDRTEPEVFISRSRCSLCQWFNHCYAIATEHQHLSLLPGVTAARYTQLTPLELTTVEALAHAPLRQLELLPGFGREVATKILRQAWSTLHNQPVIAEEHPFQPLPTDAIELYFDIEAEPSLELVYLHGVLVVNHTTQTETFYSLLAEQPEHEAIAWQQFLDLAWTYPKAPIFHFCPFEVKTVEKLAKLYETPMHLVDPLLPRFVDLHDWVTRTVTMPVESYALKHIARWLGFEWRDSSSSGAQSIYWYAQWLATGDRTYLESILVYNEDDCRATYQVKAWLETFLQQHTLAAERA